MFRKLLATLGVGASLASSAQAAELPAPYPNSGINKIYNLLFADELSLFKPNSAETAADWQTQFFSRKPKPQAIRAIAEDAGAESRVRLLAFHWLRQNRQPVPARQLLGVVVEVPLEQGLDTLAAYADGRVRYINQTGKMSIFEGAPPEIASKAKNVIAASQSVVEKIGPWNKPRLPAPRPGNIRLSFLVSDGLYFGEGPFGTMQTEPMAAPVIQKATELLLLVTKTTGQAPGTAHQ